ncbi:MAG: ABC-type transport auxiliary lipoprotein family protein [Acidobacteriota bacterium]
MSHPAVAPSTPSRPRTPGAGRLASCVLALLMAALAAGCGSAPPTRYYLLASPSVAAGAAAETATRSAEGASEERTAAGLRLGVETFAVDPPYDQNRVVFRIGEGSGEVGFYEQHRWAAPPGRLVATALASGLRGLEGLSEVEPATVTGRYDLVLTGRVICLEEIDLPDRQLARLQLDLKLYRLSDETLLWSRLLSAETAGEAADASDIMRQMQTAFEQLLGELRGELARAVSSL